PNPLSFDGLPARLQKGGGGGGVSCLTPSPLSPPPRILSQDGLVEAVRRRRYYEKPCRRRQRLAYEACRRVYSSEMGRKISFLARGSRQDPWLGC
ncbi:RT21 protein, partial [Pandion haliaetus]|nr:RT21 protein [Pandion haliaetus]